MNIRSLTFVIFILFFGVIRAGEIENKTITLSGQVTDIDSLPVPAATVMVFSDEGMISGQATDTKGEFEFIIPSDVQWPLTLEISSVSFENLNRKIGIQERENLKFHLVPQTIELSVIIVRPVELFKSDELKLSIQEITSSSNGSLIPTNPIAAIQGPEVSRTGSSHSSKLRIHGTSPVYYLNGQAVGTDPTHYGLFSFIPNSVIERMVFSPLGTSARHRLPAVVEIATPQAYGEGESASGFLSTVEATGSYRISRNNWFILGSLRQSVLDYLIRNLNINTERVGLPPTNFRDLFISGGLKISNRLRLTVDQYYVRDYLSYNIAKSTGSISGIDTYQASDEKLLSLRLDALYDSYILNLSMGARQGKRIYSAIPPGVEERKAFHVDLNETYSTGWVKTDLTLLAGEIELSGGLASEFDAGRNYSLTQSNWNFLPPFANTDNPYIYQQAINESYGEISGSIPGVRNSGYLSGIKRYDNYLIEVGLRVDNYSRLTDGTILSYRTRLGYDAGSAGQFRFYFGNFSNSPLDNIVEPYQVIIRQSINSLKSIKSQLYSIGYSNGAFKAALFGKHMHDLAVVSPDFSLLNTYETTLPEDAIAASSTGRAKFYGGSISYEKRNLLSRNVKGVISYGYARAFVNNGDLKTAHEQDFPHRIQLKIDYQKSSKLNIRADLQVRSGYPYSPILKNSSVDESNKYNESYYLAVISNENSMRFATNAFLNMSATYQVGSGEIILSLSNVTNRANPIINSAAGRIYDTGVMPMIGYRRLF